MFRQTTLNNQSEFLQLLVIQGRLSSTPVVIRGPDSFRISPGHVLGSFFELCAPHRLVNVDHPWTNSFPICVIHTSINTRLEGLPSDSNYSQYLCQCPSPPPQVPQAFSLPLPRDLRDRWKVRLTLCRTS